MVEQIGNQNPADWQLGPGISPGTQEYFESDSIAKDYDRYFEYTSLFKFDVSILENEIGRASGESLVADFGCGTGRALMALGKLGHQGLAIDLSEKMLEIVQDKASANDLTIHCAKANLVDLSGFRDDCVDHGVCLFSTLGMIQGSGNRQKAVEHFRRMIKPGGKLLIHVHNYWHTLRDPGGTRWILKNLWQSMWQKGLERGDRTYPYRGIYNMFLHGFTRSEITRVLRKSGFKQQKVIPLNPTRMDRLKHSWFFSALRCNGWIILCS